jgi:predicted nucleotidyltransferase
VNTTELLRTLERHGVDYVLIGGLAVQAYSAWRTTQDVDVIVDPTEDNYARVVAALRELHAVPRGIDADDVPDPTDPDTLRSGASLFLDTTAGPFDVLQDAAGARPYPQMRADAVAVDVSGISVRIVGLNDLIRLKRAADRPIDREDIAVLSALQRELQLPVLDEPQTTEQLDPAVALLGERPERGSGTRVWDEAADYIYLYRDTFQVRGTAEQPIGRRPAAGTRERRVWDRLDRQVHGARRKLGIADEPLPGDLGLDR